MMTEHFHFDTMDKELVCKNGNYLYRFQLHGEWALLKYYYGDRHMLTYYKKSLTNYLYSNKSSFMPEARCRTEYDCLNLWREAGFRVFKTYDDVVIDGVPPDSCRVLEYIEAPRFVTYFSDTGIPLAERLALWRRFLPVWHRRHALAIERQDPRLTHENGDLKHVMILDDGDFLFFDFEMVFRDPRRTAEVVAREISAYLKSLCKKVEPDAWRVFLRETIEHYPDTALLESTWTYFFRNPHSVLRIARLCDRLVRPDNRKPFSKYNVTRKLHDMLGAR